MLILDLKVVACLTGYNGRISHCKFLQRQWKGWAQRGSEWTKAQMSLISEADVYGEGMKNGRDVKQGKRLQERAWFQQTRQNIRDIAFGRPFPITWHSSFWSISWLFSCVATFLMGSVVNNLCVATPCPNTGLNTFKKLLLSPPSPFFFS